ncbi:RES family NAD+ phosphorylase [Parasphingorhabdus sp. NYA22]
MILDEPHKPEFAAWNSYFQFSQRVRQRSRYVWGEKVDAFLDTVLATIRNRGGNLNEGTVFYRAQLGVNWQNLIDDEDNWIGEDVWAHGSSRMKPLADRAKEGRANAVGIPVLYMGSCAETAVSEIRPWIGEEVSLSQCKLLRPLKTLDLTLGHGKSSSSFAFLGDKPLSAEEKEKAVWIDIDNAFSRPVRLTDDQADYAPTQILAELFRSHGYDAIGYKSQFGDDGDKKGYNIAVFNPDDVEIVTGAPCEVTSIKVGFQQNGNEWFRK